MRFRNDEHPRTINDLAITVGPLEEYEWPGWVRKVHGHPPTGSTLLDPEPADEDETGDSGGEAAAKRPRRSRSGADGSGTPAGEQATSGTDSDPPTNDPPGPDGQATTV